jgi:uncharacterized RDD family membrane protein YckC
MQTVRVTTSQNIDIDYEVAGVGERTLARLLDMAVFVALYILGLIVAIFAGQSILRVISFIAIIIIYASLFVFYDLICEIVMNGQSFGKRIMKIKVISLDGKRPSLGQYLLRWLFRIVDFTLSLQACGLICAAISEKQQRLGDMVAGTTLIKTHPRTQMNNLVFKPVDESYVSVFKNTELLNDKDITLLQEVIRNYQLTANRVVVNSAAERIKEILSATLPEGMDNLKFLKTVVSDYTHLASQTEV